MVVEKGEIGMKKGVIVFLMCCLLLSACSSSKNESTSTKEVSYGTTIKVENDQYLLFDANGKQVGKTFKSASSFTNGQSVVQNDKGDVGLILINGKMAVPYGKYQKLSPLGYLYKGTTKDGESVLIGPNGKELGSLKNADYNEYGLVSVHYEDKIVAYGHSGKELVSIPVKEETDFDSQSSSSLHGEYGYLSVEGKTYLFDMNTNETIDSFETDIVFKNISVLNDWLLLYNDETYKVYRDLKPVGMFEDICDHVSVRIESIECESGGKVYVLDANFEKGLLLTGQDIQYQDSDHYAIADSKKNEVVFYEAGQVIKTVTGYDFSSSGYHRPGGVYEIQNRTYDIMLYNGQGEPATQTQFSQIDDFDAQGFTSAKTDDASFIIDLQGNKVSDDFNEVSKTKWGVYTMFHIGYHDDGSVLYDDQMKEVYRGDMVDVYAEYKVDGIAIASGKDANDQTVLFNINTGQEIYRGPGSVLVDYTYFTVTQDKKVTYYAFNGQMMFEK